MMELQTITNEKSSHSNDSHPSHHDHDNIDTSSTTRLQRPLLDESSQQVNDSSQFIVSQSIQHDSQTPSPEVIETGFSATFWIMFGLLSGVLILAESSRGIVIPTLALYQQSLGGTATTLGVLVAFFSVGRLCSSYVYGRYLSQASKRAANSLNPQHVINQAVLFGLLNSLFVVFVGHLFYILAGSGGLSILIIARLLVGFGTGTLVLARTFVGDHVPSSKRSRFMAWLGIEQFVGFAFTPGLGSISVDWHIGAIHVTDYNFGSYLLGLLTFLVFCGLFMVRRWMKHQQENEIDLNTSNSSQLTSSSSLQVVVSAPGDQQEASNSSITSSHSLLNASPPPSNMSVTVSGTRFTTRSNLDLWVLVLGNLVVRGSLSLAETFGSLLYYIIIGKGDEDQVSDGAVFFLGLGVGGVFVFLSIEYLVKKLSIRWCLILGFLCGVVGYCLLVDFDGKMKTKRFVIGMILIWAVSSPLAQTTLASGLSSQLTARQKQDEATVSRGSTTNDSRRHHFVPSQALWMGHLTAAGSVGRIFYPLFGGAIWSPNNWGPVMLIAIFSHIALLIMYVWLHRRTLHDDLQDLLALVRNKLPYGLHRRLHDSTQIGM